MPHWNPVHSRALELCHEHLWYCLNNTTAEENTITALLGTGTAITGEDNSEVDFTVILGKDY